LAQQAMNDQKKRVVEVKREDLLEKLKANKVKHIAEYEEALTGYKVVAQGRLKDAYEKASIRLDERAEAAMKKIETFDPAAPENTSGYIVLVDQIGIKLEVPHNFSDDYDAAIDMMSWDIRDTIELTHAEFQCFVRDVWDWSGGFATVSALYKEFK